MLDTGRMTNTVYHYVSQIEKRVAFIAYNGAALAYDGWGILKLIQPEQIRKVAAFCHKHGLYMQTYGQMRIYAEKYCKELLIDPDLKHSEFVKVDDFEKYDGLPTPKILCVRFEDDVDQLLEEMAREFDDLFVTKSNPELIEITAIGVDKAAMLDMFCKAKGILREETVAIANSLNDLPMIEWAGVGVAVGNSDEILRGHADMVTEAEYTDGVMEAVDKLFPRH